MRVIIGKKGATRTGQTTSGCQGGGGTAVFVKKPNDTNWYLLMVAGGGGGAYSDCCTDKNPGKQAKTSENGSSGNGFKGGDGGKDGFCGGAYEDPLNGFNFTKPANSSTYVGGPGAGAFGCDKASWPNGNNDTESLPTGTKGFSESDSEGTWGFGGGGASGTSGGGGGGYSGGGYGSAYNSGGGGGSYINSSMVIEKVLTANGTTSDTKDGYVKYKFTNSDSL